MRRCSRQDRTTSPIRFRASLLTAGRNEVNPVPSLRRAPARPKREPQERERGVLVSTRAPSVLDLPVLVTWSVYQRLIAAYSHPDRRCAKSMMTRAAVAQNPRPRCRQVRLRRARPSIRLEGRFLQLCDDTAQAARTLRRHCLVGRGNVPSTSGSPEAWLT